MPEKRSFGAEISANRQRNCEFTPVQKAVIVEKLSSGASHRTVATEFKTTPSTTHAIFKRWKQDKTLDNKPRKGRPQKLTKCEIRYIILLIKKQRNITWKALIGSMDGKVTRRTIRRCISKEFSRKWRSKERIPLSKETAKLRLQFARYWKPRVKELIKVFNLELMLRFEANLHTIDYLQRRVFHPE